MEKSTKDLGTPLWNYAKTIDLLYAAIAQQDECALRVRIHRDMLAELSKEIIAAVDITDRSRMVCLNAKVNIVQTNLDGIMTFGFYDLAGEFIHRFVVTRTG